MPPPSSGGLTLALIAGQLSTYDLKGLGWHTAASVHLMAESMRRAARLEPDNAKWRVRLAGYLLDGGMVNDAAQILASIEANQLDLRNQSPAVRQQLEALTRRLKHRPAL